MVDNNDRKRHVVSKLAAGRVSENGHCARFGSLPGEFRAVMMRARQCDVQVARTYQPGVDADAANKRIAPRGLIPEQFGQTDLVSGAWPNHAPP